MTAPTGRALRLTALVGGNDTWHRRPPSTEVVHGAHAAGLPGAGVFRGIGGFGASSPIHTARPLSPGEDLPVAIMIVDPEERVRGFLPQPDEPVTPGLATSDGCEVVCRTGRAARPDDDPGTKDGIRR